jgi:transposase
MAEREANPKVVLADKGYDTDDIRGELRTRGAAPEIPTKRNRKPQYTVNRALYDMRNRIERFFNRLKECRRVATRYDHTAESFLGFTKPAAIKIWIHFVHATWPVWTLREFNAAHVDPVRPCHTPAVHRGR